MLMLDSGGYGTSVVWVALSELASDAWVARKVPGVEVASWGTDSIAYCYEAAASTGVSGLGKLISSCRANGPEMADVGCTTSDGDSDAIVPLIDSDVACCCAGTAP